MLTDPHIVHIVGSEEFSALSEQSTLSQKRSTLMDYYNQRPFGDEQEGQSSVVTSDVSDTVESILPAAMRVFTQGKRIGRFDTQNPEGDKEAEQKTLYSNWVFSQSNPGIRVLHTAFKDALLQYTGTIKVYWDDTEEVTEEVYEGLSESEFLKLRMDRESEIIDSSTREGFDGEGQSTTLIDATVKRTTSLGKIKIDNIPPEEFLVARDARDFVKPRFIGQKTPKTRSELLKMGFDSKLVDELPGYEAENLNEEENARDEQFNIGEDTNPSMNRSNDKIMLGEYYIYIDIDEDGIAELWQIFKAGNTILEKTKVDHHPYAVIETIPMPHRAYGTCPADQVADIQLIKSTLVRQGLNNAYHVNYARTIANERVDLEDLLTPRAGGVIRVDGEGPIADSLQPFVVQPQVAQILQMVEYTDTMRENRTGITRFNQGQDANSLNQTATGFKGIMDASQNREQLIIRMMAEGIKVAFEKIIALASKYQDTPTQIRTTNGVMEIDPTAWRYMMDCHVDVGLGFGDRQEKISNLSYMLQTQMDMMDRQYVLSDQKKLYNTLDKIVTELGLKDVDIYYNDPEQPNEILQAENEQLKMQVEQLSQQVQMNPLAEAEAVKAQAGLVKAQGDAELKLLQEHSKREMHSEDLMFKYDELETKENTDIPGKGSTG